jgi:ACR3 family arsenite transporter
MLIFYLEIMLPLFGIKVRIEYNRCSNRNNSWYLFRIPFALAVISRYAIKKFIGDKWFNQKFIPFVSPITLIALLLIVSCLV